MSGSDPVSDGNGYAEHAFFVTVFETPAASARDEYLLGLDALANAIRVAVAPEKRFLPWLKLARFGDVRTDKGGSLRHNANLICVTGVEADYDGEQMSVDEALVALHQAGLAAILYTSPSHTVARPRWRVLCPFAQPHPVRDRDRQMNRLNGLFGGIFGPESWVLSQAYYFGHVDDATAVAEARVEVVTGAPIDTLDFLDYGAFGCIIGANGGGGGGSGSDCAGNVAASPRPALTRGGADWQAYEDFRLALLRSWDRNMPQYDAERRKHVELLALSRTLGGIADVLGFDDETAVSWLMPALAAVDADDENARTTALDGLRYGRARPFVPKGMMVGMAGMAGAGSGADIRRVDAAPALTAVAEGPMTIAAGVAPMAGVVQSNTSDRAGAVGGGAPEPPIRNEPMKAAPNVAMVRDEIAQHADLRDLVQYDLMALAPTLMRAVPGSGVQEDHFPRLLRDADVVALMERLQRMGLPKLTDKVVWQAVERNADITRFHPIRDQMDALVWDGVQRVDWQAGCNWLHTYLGAEDTPYTRRIGEMFLLSMIARVYQPGCKADHVMVWQGAQGILKSTACRVLAGAEWFSDHLPDIHRNDKEAQQHLPGKWLIEVPELSKFKPAGIEILKAFISRQEEKYRKSYGRLQSVEPRQCVFIGTTNEDVFLTDATGNRRFWPVTLGEIDIAALRRDRDQIMAEAVMLYRAGRPWWAEKAWEAEFIQPEQEARFDADLLEQVVDEALRPISKVVTLLDVMRRAGPAYFDTSRTSTRDQRRLADIMTRLGWRRAPRGPNGERFWQPSNIKQWEKGRGKFDMTPWRTNVSDKNTAASVKVFYDDNVVKLRDQP